MTTQTSNEIIPLKVRLFKCELLNEVIPYEKIAENEYTEVHPLPFTRNAFNVVIPVRFFADSLGGQGSGFRYLHITEANLKNWVTHIVTGYDFSTGHLTLIRVIGHPYMILCKNGYEDQLHKIPADEFDIVGHDLMQMVLSHLADTNKEVGCHV